MTPDPPQQIAEAAPATWHAVDLAWRLNALDVCVLLVLGVFVAALAWMVTEFLARGGAPRLAVTWAPIVFCTVQAAWLFPAALLGVQPDHTMPVWVQALLVLTALGPAGGLGAKVAHAAGEQLMQATLGRIVDFIRPRNSSSPGGGNAP